MDAPGLVRRAVSADGIILKGAHILPQALECPASLVVFHALNAFNELFALGIDVRGQKQPAARRRGEPKLAEQGYDLAKHIRLSGEKGVLGKARIEADGLDLAELSHRRLDLRAVERVEPPGDAAHIRKRLCAAPQHIRQQGVFRRRFAAQLREQICRETAGFEFLGLYRCQ